MKLFSSAGKLRFLAAVVFVVSAALPLAAQDATKLAQAVQNPVSDLISVPFQYNANFDVGVDKSVQHVLNIQPVYPIKLNPSWNLITRTIIPVISQPPLAVGQDRQSGIGDVQLSLFLTPAKTSKFIWGAGLVGQFDTATDDLLGQGKWGLGPTAVALKISGPWVVGGLVNNIWSVGGDESRSDVDQMLLQPLVNYNFPQHPGRYLTFSPIVTANWKADSGNVWTVPLGLGIGQITKFGKLPVNLQASGYYNVERPELTGARWQLRLQVALLFPKK